ncbi:MAG: hypothetical protein KC476_00050 [Cyanobacteria bacterium HKST-UBA06]|nr:hypothetical protein [Cyanobacteria bacterium HKST-UBA05]MCA9799038.1 hypothetical protein [Cyanobacteria bacterium HKST-UBA04]MCA9806319.1 hypothetical protein [Cyanobacteria bacterium HKST-UBA06]MCA9840678.1 hypothetical protein [Cyanobacteria bacterium HKST-UBA03]
MTDPTPQATETDPTAGPDYAEFEIGKHRVPWFLWVFFVLIVSWASISWIKFFGY